LGVGGSEMQAPGFVLDAVTGYVQQNEIVPGGLAKHLVEPKSNILC
jgi:hypothetical protein